MRFTYGPPQGCGGSLTVSESQSTVVESLDISQNQNYEPDLNCQWRISAENPAKVLKMTFSRFNIERDSNETSVTCWDYLEIRDGHGPFSPLIGHFCGTENPIPITSSTGFLWVKFFSDSTNNLPGFRATVQSIDPVCGSHVPINVTEDQQVCV